MGNLTADLTSFIGRRRELTEIRAALGASRLITLTGPGGVGKTRLARQVAASSQRGFPDGVWEVGLANLVDPGQLIATIASALGLRDQNDPWTEERLQDWLAPRRLLLLLDNCEHLIHPCAIIADRLLTSCAELHILATSRESLRIHGEQVYPVEPLPVPDPADTSLDSIAANDALALLVDRGAAVRPGFTVTGNNAAALAQLCRRLDGIPLAIELAAGWLRTLSPRELLHVLSDPYGLPIRGNRSAPARQQSLSALVDWSYQLCDDGEQALWRALSVFADGFELEAATAVWGQQEQDIFVIDLIDRLVAKSILVCVHNADSVRYRMPQIIREFGANRLRQAGDHMAVRDRFLTWCASFADEARSGWIGREQVQWFHRVRRELPNIRKACEICASEPGRGSTTIKIISGMMDYWVGLGLLSEGRYWLSKAVPTEAPPSADRLAALRTAAILAALQGDHAAAAQFVAEGTEFADGIDSASERAWLVYASALSAMTADNLATARQLYAHCRRLFTALEDLDGLEWTLCDTSMLEAVSVTSTRRTTPWVPFSASPSRGTNSGLPTMSCGPRAMHTGRWAMTPAHGSP
jgi:predicted ATPase